MKLRILPWLVSSLMWSGVCAAQENATISLTVIETGFSKFLAGDEKGKEYEFQIVKHTTKYDPEDWQMAEGDQVLIEYVPVSENLPNQTCVLVRLEKPGVKTATLVNPIDGQVADISHSSITINKQVEKDVVSYKLFINRQTRFIPSDWKPQVGDQVIIDYSNRSARAIGQILTARQIEKAE